VCIILILILTLVSLILFAIMALHFHEYPFVGRTAQTLSFVSFGLGIAGPFLWFIVGFLTNEPLRLESPNAIRFEFLAVGWWMPLVGAVLSWIAGAVVMADVVVPTGDLVRI
jgi:hypothetical protein